jgi:hypothetical protein
LGSSFSSQYPAQLQSSPPKKKEKFRSFHSAKDPALGYTADVLKEEYFDGHEGVDFLGDDMPFFLVNAGKDLFFEPRQPATEYNSVHEEQTKATSKPSGDSDQSDLAALPSLQHPSGNDAPVVADYEDEDSILSTVASSIFSTQNESSQKQDVEIHTGEENGKRSDSPAFVHGH